MRVDTPLFSAAEWTSRGGPRGFDAHEPTKVAVQAMFGDLAKHFYVKGALLKNVAVAEAFSLRTRTRSGTRRRIT